MKPALLFSIAGVVLFFIGLFGLIAYEHLLKKILSANIMGTGVFLFLVSVASRTSGLQPDPVPHAMVLTGIVVTVSATALSLTLLKRIYSATGKPYIEDDENK